MLVPCTSLTAYHGITASLRHIQLLWLEVPPRLQVGCCSPMVFQVWKGPSCLTSVCSLGCPGSSALAPGAPSPLLPHWPGCVQGCFFQIFSFLSPAAAVEFGWVFYHFSNALYQRCYHCYWAWPLPVVGPAWRQLASVLQDVGEASGNFSQRPTLYLPTTMKEFSCQSNTNLNLYLRGCKNLFFV